jgi:hypothetical protein
MEYRYTLESGSKKYQCPNCEKRTFKRYIDLENDEYLNDKVGRCDREVKCGYHYTPKSYFNDNSIDIDYKPLKRLKKPIKPISIISPEIVNSSLKNNDNFTSYLSNLFDDNTANQLVEKYKIGSSNHWVGATVFWQIDKNQRVRTGKVMLYENGSRVKKPYNHINWVHSVLKLPDYNLKQCFFGEHLINENKPIAIVESEKTAIISSVFYPKFNWIATGGLSNLNYDNTKVLHDKKVVLYPDAGCYDKWKSKADEIGLKCDVSKIIENENNSNGYDIADYLIECENEKDEVDELEEYFEKNKPPYPLDLFGIEITHIREFINENFKIIRSYSKDDAQPFIDRLNDIKNVTEYYKNRVQYY